MTQHSSPVTDVLYARYVEILGRLQSAWGDNGGNAKINNEDLLILEQAGGRVHRHAQAPLWEGSPQWQFVQRLQAYLDDAPADGRHSDAAGGNAYDLIEEAIGWMTPSVPSTDGQQGAAEIERLRAQVNAAREFVKRHPALTLIDLAEFEVFLKVMDAIAPALPSTNSNPTGNIEGGA